MRKARSLSGSEYQALLDETDDALLARVQALRDAELARMDGAQRGLATELKRRLKAIRSAHPPTPAEAGHRELVAALEDLVQVVDRRGLDEYRTTTGVPFDQRYRRGREVLLTLLATDPGAERLRSASARLVPLGVRFGRFLPGPPGEPWRPMNGAILQYRNRRGRRTRLNVENLLDQDIAVSLVEENSPPAIPTLMCYVRTGSTISTNRIPPRFHIYYKSGTAWNNGTRQFTHGRRYHRCAEVVDISGKQDVTITLGNPENRPEHPSVGLLGQAWGQDWADMVRNLPGRAAGTPLSTDDVEPY